jgi:catechol 2,3-dioxygenase-like lactoylglutathione lyase family enzyme
MRYLVITVLLLVLTDPGLAQPTPVHGKFVHSVYFWLNNPDDETEKTEFISALTEFISKSQYVSSYHIAPAAGTPRDVVDNTYTYNLVCTFESAELQDLYQQENVHKEFIEKASHLWKKVQIYDSYPGIPISSTYSRGEIQIGVVVTDLERSVNFYTNVLGMVKAREFSVNEEFASSSGLSGGRPFDVMVLKTSDNPGASEWKLMSFDNGVIPRPSDHIQDDIGMQYITLYVNEMDLILSRLDAAGIPLLGDTPVELSDGKRFVLIRDPDGIFIELIGD